MMFGKRNKNDNGSVLSAESGEEINNAAELMTARDMDRIRRSKKSTKAKSSKAKVGMPIRKVPKSVQDTMPYEAVVDNSIMLVQQYTDGYHKYSRTYEFDDINYASADDPEQENLFLAYASVLNGFDTTVDVQVTLHNNKYNKADFEKKILLSDRGDGYDMYRHEYNQMLKSRMKEGQNGIIRKKYITVTVSAISLELALQQFNAIEIHLKTSFQKLGTGVRRLNSNERIRILTDVFRGANRYVADFKESEFQRQAEKSLCCPDYIEFKKDYFMFDNKYARTFFIRQLPTGMNDEVLTDVTETNLNLIITVNIAPISPDEAIKIVNRQLTAMRANKIEKSRKAAARGVFGVDVMSDNFNKQLEDAERLLDDLSSKNQKLFQCSFCVMLIADSYDELESQSAVIEGVFAKHIATLAKATFQQEVVMRSTLPVGNCQLDVKRSLTTEALTVFMPFKSRELNQAGGVYYGLNQISNNMIIFDKTRLKNCNGFILGSPGSGKSFSAKREMVNVFLATKADIIIVDPEREYTNLARALGGEIVFISESSGSHLNPMEINSEADEDPIKSKFSFMKSFFQTILAPTAIDSEQASIIDMCNKDVYTPFLIGDKKDMPTLRDYYTALEKYTHQYDSAVPLYNALSLYVEGSLNTFSYPSNVKTNARVVVYDLKDLGKSLKALGMMIVMENLWDRIVQNRQKGIRTYIYMDEIYLLFSNEETANFLFELYKRARKWGGVPTGITQNVEDLLHSATARTMLANSEFIYMLNQSATDRETLSRLLKIPDTQMQYVEGAAAGSGLMYFGASGCIPFKDEFPTDTELYKLMTTKFGEE